MSDSERKTWRLATTGVVGLAAVTLLPLLFVLYRLMLGLVAPAELPTPMMIATVAGFGIVIVGFVVCAMIALLRLKPRELDDGAPSFVPGLAVVLVGAALCAVTVLVNGPK
jgi:hypothetical protein